MVDRRSSACTATRRGLIAGLERWNGKSDASASTLVRLGCGERGLSPIDYLILRDDLRRRGDRLVPQWNHVAEVCNVQVLVTAIIY